MRTHTKLLLIGACALTIVSHESYAFSSHDIQRISQSSFTVVSDNRDEIAEAFVNDMARDAISFLSDTGLSETTKQQRFSRLLKRSFDMPTIGRFALGKYWRQASAQQRDEYQSLFRDMIIEVYSRRFGEYKGQGLNVSGSRTMQKNDVAVSTLVVPKDGGPKVKVDWRLRKKNGQYKVIDIIVEGVSMALTQRSDFSSVIQRGGGQVSVLLDHLRAQ
ncbi:MAG: phospholipid-binding protein MlaC [Bdellovibrionales bacterium]